MSDQIKVGDVWSQIPGQRERLAQIFTPDTVRRRLSYFRRDVGQTSAKLVHYTSADAALSIIRTKRLRMRSAVCMADYTEIQHGYSCLSAAFRDNSINTRLFEALDECHTGAAIEAFLRFDQMWRDSIRMETYISCLSEHEASESRQGRLSMWRGLGGGPRVAIVLNVPSDSLVTLALGINFTPVSYGGEGFVARMLDGVAESVRKNCDFLTALEKDVLSDCVVEMLMEGVTCQKHEGFHEEREWRAIYQPKLLASPLMESSVQVVQGVPQLVYDIPLDVSKSVELKDLEFSKIFDSLILGPSSFGGPIRSAFISTLEAAGVDGASAKVVLSDIPIRA